MNLVKNISFIRARSVFFRQKLALVVLAVALVCAGVRAISPQRISVPNLAPNRNAVRLLRDDYDVAVYMQRGSFVLKPGTRPYRDVFSEYPQLATYLFALPYVHVLVYPKGYSVIFSVMMALALGALAFVWLALARDIGVNEKRVLFLLLPGMLYFTLNRFDVIPALLSVSSLYLLVRKRTMAAHAVLALAVLTKAYPLIYIPLFAVESLRQGGVRKAALGLAAFAAVIVACSAQLAFWAGATAVVAPFILHLGRPGEESLYFLLSSLMPLLVETIRPTFVVLQGILPLAFLVVHPSSPRALLRWAAASTMAFVTFTTFQSPQWTVWITPLVLLAASTKWELMLAILLDVLSYVYFPLVYDLAPQSFLLLVIAALTTARVTLMFLCLRDPESEAVTARAIAVPS